MLTIKYLVQKWSRLVNFRAIGDIKTHLLMSLAQYIHVAITSGQRVKIYTYIPSGAMD